MSELDRDRLQRALSGDRAALGAVVEIMTPVVRARVVRALGRRLGYRSRDMATEVADFTQDVFVALFSADAKALRAWDPERGLSFLNFVGLLAQRRVVEILRTRRWQIQAEEVPLSESQLRVAHAEPEDESDAALNSDHMRRRLLEHLEATLSVRGLEMFERLYLRGQAIEQVCAETGLSADAVYQWRSRLSKAARDGLRALESPRKLGSWNPAATRASRGAR